MKFHIHKNENSSSPYALHAEIRDEENDLVAICNAAHKDHERNSQILAAAPLMAEALKKIAALNYRSGATNGAAYEAHKISTECLKAAGLNDENEGV